MSSLSSVAAAARVVHVHQVETPLGVGHGDIDYSLLTVAFSVLVLMFYCCRRRRVEQPVYTTTTAAKLAKRDLRRANEVHLRRYLLTGTCDVPPEVFEYEEGELEYSERNRIFVRREYDDRENRRALALLTQLRNLEKHEDRMMQTIEGWDLGARQRVLLAEFREIDHHAQGHGRPFVNCLIRQLQDFSDTTEGELRITAQRALDGYFVQNRVEDAAKQVLQHTLDAFVVAHFPGTLRQDFQE